MVIETIGGPETDPESGAVHLHALVTTKDRTKALFVDLAACPPQALTAQDAIGIEGRVSGCGRGAPCPLLRSWGPRAAKNARQAFAPAGNPAIAHRSIEQAQHFLP